MSMQPRRRLTRQEQKELTRHRLLEAAWELFAEHGYAAVSLDAIAERAGYTRTPIHSQFGSKEALFYELWIARSEPVRWPSESVPLGTSIADYLREHGLRDEWLHHPEARLRTELRMVVTALLLRNPELMNRYAAGTKAMIRRLAHELQEYANAAGEKLPLPAERLAILMSAVNLGLLDLAQFPVFDVTSQDFLYAHLALLTGTKDRDTADTLTGPS